MFLQRCKTDGFVHRVRGHQAQYALASRKHATWLWYFQVTSTLPETDIAPHLKMDGWKISFHLGRPIFRGSVSFREGSLGPFGLFKVVFSSVQRMFFGGFLLVEYRD